MSTSVRRACAALTVLAGLLLATPACHSPTRYTDANWDQYPDTSWTDTDRDVHGRPVVWEQILYYFPNRIVDALEIVNVSFGLGVGLGLDVRITKWLQLAALGGAGVGVTWDNRFARPTFGWAGATWAFGPWRGGAGAGQVANVGAWEVGAGFAGGKVAVDLAEAADFILGWFFIDILEDDYGWVEARY